MKIVVQVAGVIEGTSADREFYEGDEVTADSEGGELYVEVRDREGNLVHWVRYAQGQWIKTCMVEGMSADVVAVRDARVSQIQQFPEITRANGLPIVAGNSGPGY